MVRDVVPDWTLGDLTLAIAVVVLIGGFVLGYSIGQVNQRLLRGMGVDELTEGTPFERTARNLNTSTVSLIARLSSWFIYGVTIVVALEIADVVDASQLWAQVPAFIPQVFVGVLILLAGIIIADKLELILRERLQAIKVPQVNVLPLGVRYSVLFLALLLALSQVGVAISALLILLAAYLFGLVVFGTVAFRHLLTSGGAGVYLLLNQPYAIGDEVCIDGHCGIVQDFDVFVTHVEDDGEEHLIPNHKILRHGVVRMQR